MPKIDYPSFAKKYTSDPDKFPFGIRIYVGAQGEGKTLSMIHDLRDIYNTFDDCYIVSNIKLNIPVDYTFFIGIDGLVNALDDIEKNHLKHVIILLDEGLTYFAENGGIDPALMSKITQNRKNRRFFMISTQQFTRLNNRIRDFSTESVLCSHFMNIQINQIRDDQKLAWDKNQMAYIGPKKYTTVFKRNNDLFKLYDTYQVIKIDKKLKMGGTLGAKSPPFPLAVKK